MIDNTYVVVGDRIFRQHVGIPMGTDCAPFLANLFLYAYEFNWLNSKLIKRDFSTLNYFIRTCRYIDDLLTINNDGLLMKYKNEIYPPELGLTSDNKDNKQVNYLDLRIELKKIYLL